ncbi:glycosyltransferase family 4 protein [Sulfurimonas sp. HSL1-2]|uniref:glycosyltransferase family 4 protein n=1 Tax=Thiomicrolovo zhangzhouensis TaxID=3131933 RepID=UPI0031F75783
MQPSKHLTIAIVINTSWNIYNFRRGLVKALQAEGHRIVCIAPRDDYSEKLQALGCAYREISMNNKGTNPLEDARLIRDFYRLFKEVRPDVLLQYTIKPNIYGSMAAGLLGIPVISNISGLGTVFINDNLASKIAKMLYKTALRIPKKVFFQNVQDRELFIHSKLVKAEKTGLLPGSGIDSTRFAPRPARVSDGIVRFLFIARLVRDKGIMEYAEAAKMINQQFNAQKVKFMILGAYYPGNPTAITETEMKAWEAEGTVEYLGTSDDVASVIAGIDCVVLPSYREGLSRVLLEAAAMAKPIVTTDVPGCREVVDDSVNGYLCQVKDTGSLAEAMMKMLRLTEVQRSAMGQKGREKVCREFDEQIVIDRYREAIAGAVQR